jgi:hypothetical protein
MVEQANASECHCDTVLVASLDDIVITNRTTCLSDELNARLVSALDVVAEWEERI